jgi:hypothetical protein
MSTTATTPSTSELIEGVLFYPIALVVSATIFPGFTLVIPGLLLVTAMVLIPVIAIALVVLLAASVVATPFLLVRGVRALRARLAESRRRPRVLRRSGQAAVGALPRTTTSSGAPSISRTTATTTS